MATDCFQTIGCGEKLRKARSESLIEKSPQEELKEKTAQMNRYRRDAADFHKQLQSKDLLCNKLASDRTALKGALIEPNKATKFPRTVLACKECYVKNLACDLNVLY